ncbi:NADH-quinone oxidoreductase subunit N [Marinithermofilum abyssi]|uniref:NADH-quinone oxidoreductase subunit N n=1 Tax=Marinithermofilum abyssi TaxID=1571185 RepID=A0A8J2VFV5_9BACL|nr:NADH-quinone oxidoreductase subunit N [Marinithermofilum abyssi]GGE05140.1 NADH-quinone oxidoreductase subunit N [Marinithermofilum abyssi]
MEKVLLDYDWTVMAPEIIIAAAAALLSLADLFLRENTDRRFFSWFSLAAVIAAIFFTVSRFGQQPYEILGDTYRVDDFALAFKTAVLSGVGLVFLLSAWGVRQEEIRFRGEYDYLLLAAALGAMIMTSSADLITLFVGLELLSISSYILAGIHRERYASNEAAWKYVVQGGVASAFILYGMSFVYGLTGSTNLYTIQQRLVEAYQTGYDAFVLLSLFLMLLGFGFKIASAPFHMWVPDVYQGAPTPVTSFLAVVSKTAAFALVLRIVLVGYIFLYQMQIWQQVVEPVLLVLAGLSMVIGNTAALHQTDTKRLLAYSSVAHAGYLLVPLSTLGAVLFESTFYYLIAYLVMTMGAFTVAALLEREAGHGNISGFAGLSRRSPGTAAAMTVFLLSLAGIPVTAGFFGKFYILMNALSTQHFWIAGIMVGTTVISYYYYFGIIRQMYFRPPASKDRMRVPMVPALLLVIGILGTVGLGVVPEWAVHWIGDLQWMSALTPLNAGPPGP